MVTIALISAGLNASAKPIRKDFSVKSEKQKLLEKKLRSIIIDKVEFDDAVPSTIFKYLRIESKRLDPEKKGVNFVFQNVDASRKTVTLILDKVPLLYIIKTVCSASGLAYRIDDYAVFIQPKPKSAGK
jgi:hypothetical protein